MSQPKPTAPDPVIEVTSRALGGALVHDQVINVLLVTGDLHSLVVHMVLIGMELERRNSRYLDLFDAYRGLWEDDVERAADTLDSFLMS